MKIRQSIVILSTIVFTLANRQTLGNVTTISSLIAEITKETPDYQRASEKITKFLQRELLDETSNSSVTNGNDEIKNNLLEKLTKNVKNETSNDNVKKQGTSFYNDKISSVIAQTMKNSTDIIPTKDSRINIEKFANNESFSIDRVSNEGLKKYQDNSQRETNVRTKISKNDSANVVIFDNSLLTTLKPQIFNIESTESIGRQRVTQNSEFKVTNNVTASKELTRDRSKQLNDKAKRNNKISAIFRMTMDDDRENEESFKSIESKAKLLIAEMKKLPKDRRARIASSYDLILAKILSFVKQQDKNDFKNTNDIFSSICSNRRNGGKKYCCRTKKRKNKYDKIVDKKFNGESNKIDESNSDFYVTKNMRRTIPESQEIAFLKLEQTTVGVATTVAPSTTTAVTTTRTTTTTTTTTTEAPPAREKIIETLAKKNSRRNKPSVLRNRKMAGNIVKARSKCQRARNTKRKDESSEQEEEFDDEETEKPDYRRNFDDIDEQLGPLTEIIPKDSVDDVTELSSRY